MNTFYKTLFLQSGYRKFWNRENKSPLIRLTLWQAHGQAPSIHKGYYTANQK
jgi:hypothetical protein